MRYIQSYEPSLKFVVAIVNDSCAGYTPPFIDLTKGTIYKVISGAGYTPPFIDLTKGTIYKVISGGTDQGKPVLTLNSNGRQIGLWVHKRFRHPYKNELKKVIE